MTIRRRSGQINKTKATQQTRQIRKADAYYAEKESNIERKLLETAGQPVIDNYTFFSVRLSNAGGVNPQQQRNHKAS